MKTVTSLLKIAFAFLFVALASAKENGIRGLGERPNIPLYGTPANPPNGPDDVGPNTVADPDPESDWALQCVRCMLNPFVSSCGGCGDGGSF